MNAAAPAWSDPAPCWASSGRSSWQHGRRCRRAWRYHPCTALAGPIGPDLAFLVGIGRPTSMANCRRSRCRPTTTNQAAATGAPGDKATTTAYLDDGPVLINTAAFVLLSSGRQHPAQNCETPVRSKGAIIEYG
jgi:hypothetical protein